jgi:ADP-L-glycero-D-manno-heptose 6-epimerase
MKDHSTIVITGAAGFIGSCLAGFLNKKGFENLILVDEFRSPDKFPNLDAKKWSAKVEREDFFEWISRQKIPVDFFFHIGARTDTAEFDYPILRRLNLEYSQQVWQYCTAGGVPLVYASSAATYGAGEFGYADDHEIIESLQPLNPYGISKNEFDKWALKQSGHPPFWAGLKFFNVYGPNEYHKGRMASVIYNGFQQIKNTGEVKLFKSHRPDFKDGQQLRDFVYIKDLLKICYWLMENQPSSGVYNLGTGLARTFEDLVKSSFAGLDLPPRITYIDMPGDIRDKYQYFTEARMQKLRNAGYTDAFYPLEEGVDDYVRNYLVKGKYF